MTGETTKQQRTGVGKLVRKWAFRLVAAIVTLALLAIAGVVAQRRFNLPSSKVELAPGSEIAAWHQPPDRPNILLLTVDDMNWNSAGILGADVRGVTPHIDALAGQGMLFKLAFVTSPICQPSRSVWMTGMYPPRNGATGFNRIHDDVPTLADTLRSSGYRVGIVNKVTHTPPYTPDRWDYFIGERDNGVGRIPEKMGEQAEAFFRDAAQRGKPFFLNMNINDPHRPFAGTSNPLALLDRAAGLAYPAGPADAYKPGDAPIPGFLPQAPGISREMAEYFTSVHRADRSVGAVLAALERSGAAPYTLVILVSDNGMAFPFGKSTLYENGTRTLMMVRWPDRVAVGRVDDSHMVSGIDIAPTILDAAGVPSPVTLDGRSLLPVLAGEGDEGPDYVFTYLAKVNTDLVPFLDLDFTSRAVRSRDGTLYIWSPWADGKKAFVAEAMLGRTYPAMQELAEKDPAVAARVDLFRHRVTEELYDVDRDPDGLTNLADNKAHAERLAALRQVLLRHLEETNDPALDRYRAFLAGKTKGGAS